MSYWPFMTSGIRCALHTEESTALWRDTSELAIHCALALYNISSLFGSSSYPETSINSRLSQTILMASLNLLRSASTLILGQIVSARLFD